MATGPRRWMTHPAATEHASITGSMGHAFAMTNSRHAAIEGGDARLRCPVCGSPELTVPPYAEYVGTVPADAGPPDANFLGRPSYEVCPPAASSSVTTTTQVETRARRPLSSTARNGTEKGPPAARRNDAPA
jgi:hypothetical protein